MKFLLQSGVVLTLAVLLLSGGAVFAQNDFGEDPTGGTGLVIPCNTDVNEQGQFVNKCDFAKLIAQVERVMNWVFYIAAPLAAVIFTYAGFTYMTAQGNPGEIAKAHGLFRNVAIGFIIILVAWLAVYTLVNAIIEPGRFNLDQWLKRP